MTQSKNIYSFDLLKFLMAAVIVAHHTKACIHIDSLYFLNEALQNVSVPIFFTLSSFFLFRKCRDNSFSWNSLGYFCKRLGLLYLSWFIISLPIFIFHNLDVFKTSLRGSLEFFIHSVLCSSTFSGFWFITALLESVVLFFIFKKCHVPDIVQLIFSYGLIVYMWLFSNNLIPDSNLWLGKFLKEVFQGELSMTVCKGYFWIVFGYLLSSHANKALWNSIKNKVNNMGTVLLIVFIVALLQCSMRLEVPTAISTVIFSYLLLTAFFCLKLPESTIYKELRIKSILIFFIHFIVNIAYSMIVKGYYSNGLLCFFVVYIVSYLLADFVVRISRSSLKISVLFKYLY